MCDFVRWLALLSTFLLWSACGFSLPPNPSGNSASSNKDSETEFALKLEQQKIRAGFVLLTDGDGSQTVPILSDAAFARLGEALKREIGRILPVALQEISTEGIGPSGLSRARSVDLARQQGFEYLAVVVVSCNEQEYPVSLYLGWTAHGQLGYRRDNWSRLELALLDLNGDRIVMQEEGRGWATLDRPAVPGIDQWYPVVYLRPQDPERRFRPSTFEGALDTLREVSCEQAAKRLILKLENSWLGRWKLTGRRALSLSVIPTGQRWGRLSPPSKEARSDFPTQSHGDFSSLKLEEGLV